MGKKERASALAFFKDYEGKKNPDAPDEIQSQVKPKPKAKKTSLTRVPETVEGDQANTGQSVTAAADTAVTIPTDEIVVWPLANRLFFDEESMATLTESIASSRQTQPALLRPLDPADPRAGTGEKKYELIYGARRLRACQQLEIGLLAVVRQLSDREAASEMDSENRPREDITVYERACDYARWIERGLFSNASEISAHIGKNRTTVHRLLAISKLPETVPLSFPSPADLTFSYAYDLAVAIGDSTTAYAAVAEAAELLKTFTGKELSVAVRKTRLLNAASHALMAEEKPSNESRDEVDNTPAKTGEKSNFQNIEPLTVTDKAGKTIGRVHVTRSGEIRMRIRQRKSTEEAMDVMAQIKSALEHLDIES